MNINEQGGEYLRLIQERTAVEVEIASLRAGLRRFGICLAANAKTIKDDPIIWNTDSECFCADFRASATNAERLRELSWQFEEIRVALEGYEKALVRG